MKKIFYCIFLAFYYSSSTAQDVRPDTLAEKTSFQVSAPWQAEYDVRSDVAIVYGINENNVPFEERVKGWKEKGYNVNFMTGIAWGTYQDYFLGKFDGKTHWDESQLQRNGDKMGMVN